MASLDEYELFLEYVGELVDRRQAITTTYVSVNGAGIGAGAFLFKDGQLSGTVQQA